MTPDIVQFVCILSTQGGYAFIFLDTQRIYNDLCVVNECVSSVLHVFH